MRLSTHGPSKRRAPRPAQARPALMLFHEPGELRLEAYREHLAHAAATFGDGLDFIRTPRTQYEGLVTRLGMNESGSSLAILDFGKPFWVLECPALSEDSAPAASLVGPKAQAAPADPGAPPEQLGGAPWPRQLASRPPPKTRVARLFCARLLLFGPDLAPEGVEQCPSSAPRGFCAGWRGMWAEFLQVRGAG